MFNKALKVLIFCVILKLVSLTPQNSAPNQPRIISKGAHIKVKEGDDIELKCLIENLGKYVTFWKVKRRVLLAVNLRIDRDHTISRNRSTGALFIRKFKEKNSGDYICVLKTYPPQEIRYHLQLINDKIQEIKTENYTTIQPKFISKGADIKVKEGDDIELQCLVENLGQFTAQWRLKGRLFSADNLRLNWYSRFSKQDSAGLLLIKQFRAENSGEYRCQLNIKPPQEIIYQLQLDDIKIEKLTEENSILCDGHIQEFTSERGIITTYNYPEDYSNNLNCQFRIIAKLNMIIVVNFETFNTEATHDVLKIYDSWNTSSILVNTFSGNEIPLRIVSTSNYLYFNFNTDTRNTMSGFKLNYKSIKSKFL